MRTAKLTPVLNYIRKLFVAEDDLLKDIDSRIRQYDRAIHIAPEDGKLLYLLLKLINARKVVEIGTLAGYSSIWMAKALPEHGVLHTIEHDVKRQILAEETFKKFHGSCNIVLHKLSAKIALQELSNIAPFDAIFIDADKISYLEYLDWAEQNIRYGGIIIGDNTLLAGNVYKENKDINVSNTAIQVMKEFNLRLSDENKYASILLPSQDGITVAMKIF